MKYLLLQFLKDIDFFTYLYAPTPSPITLSHATLLPAVTIEHPPKWLDEFMNARLIDNPEHDPTIPLPSNQPGIRRNIAQLDITDMIELIERVHGWYQPGF